MNFSTIQSEGSLISADLLMEIASGTASGQQPADFGVSNPTSLNNEIAASWSDARAYWDAFQHGLRRVGPNESGATPTRELWMLPVLRSLGFDGIAFARSAAIVGGQSYAVSHRLEDGDDGLPVHIEGANKDLDKRSPTGRPRISPHSLLQEYLNRTDHLWGMLSNGYSLRILRNARMSRSPGTRGRDGGYTERGDAARMGGEGLDVSVSDRSCMNYYPPIQYK